MCLKKSTCDYLLWVRGTLAAARVDNSIMHHAQVCEALSQQAIISFDTSVDVIVKADSIL